MHALAQPLAIVSLSNSLSFFFDTLLSSGESATFGVTPHQPFSIVFHQTDKFHIIFTLRGSDGILSQIVYSDVNLSRLVRFDATYSIESFIITALSTQRFAFSFFAVYPSGGIFITNRANARFSFWDSFTRFKCSQTTSVSVILNITSSYTLSSDRSVESLTSNKSHQIQSFPFLFERPSILHFKGLSCLDNFSFSIQSDTEMTETFEISIPDPYERPLEISRARFTVEPDQSADYPIVIGVAVILIALASIAGGIAFRGLFRDDNRRFTTRKVVQIAPDVEEPEAPPPPPCYFPSQCHLRPRYGDSSENCVDADQDQVMFSSDPYHVNASAMYANQQWIEPPMEPDSPYDIGPTDC
jgi:hypothetical protein